MTLTRPGDQHWRMWHESTAAPAVLVCLLSRSYQGQHRPVLHQNNGNKVIWRSRTIRHRHAHYDVVFVCIELPTRCSRYFFLFCCFFVFFLFRLQNKAWNVSAYFLSFTLISVDICLFIIIITILHYHSSTPCSINRPTYPFHKYFPSHTAGTPSTMPT